MDISRRGLGLGLLGTIGSAGLRPSLAYADSAALAADLPVLQRAYEALHPGLYRYQTPDQFRQRLAEAAAALKLPSDLDRQYLALSRLTASVRCGHTYANFYNQSKAVVEKLFSGKDKLPFYFVWVGSQMVVSANPLGLGGLDRGTEIVSIDGVSVAEIQAELMPYLRADGSNDAKRRKLLDTTGGDRFETFDIFYALLYPPKSPRFRLGIRHRPNGPVLTLMVDAIDQEERRQMAPPGADASAPGYWTLGYPRRGIGRLTMPGWALYDKKWDWHARIDAIFDDLACNRAQGLVIDLRDNEGGLDCGYDLIARFIGYELPLFTDYERRVRFRTVPDDIVPNLDTWDWSFLRLGEGADDLGNGFYRLATDGELGGIKPKAPRFEGKVAVLCGAQNSSATFNFIDLVQRHGLGRVYGEPTGGNQRGINGGCFFFLRLPHSGLEVDLPLIGEFPTASKPDAGLRPDVFVAPGVADVALGRDPVLERALADMA